MSKVSVFDPAWIDLVFEGRNKKYGAYQLRREDSKTTGLALLLGIGLMVSLVGIPAAANYLSPTEAVVTEKTTREIIIHDIEPPVFKEKEPEKPKPEPVFEEPAPKAAAPAASAPTTRFKPLAPTSEPVETPPTINDVHTSNPGSVTTPGTEGGISTTSTTAGVPGGTGENDEGEGTEIITTAAVDVMPFFPGGMKEFYEQVGKKFRTPDIASNSVLKVYVSFIVEKDGSMSNIKVARDPGNGMAKEAIRVLQSIKTKWEPGKKNGKPVRTAYSLPIVVNMK
ncbi:hypothetical protein GR160_10355 [Flavobacterium sp. Sd200]|uniref:energy transducer TonB n=1 Tax=Flavobacterium sp. Sd200 TaxID=2692211 RepID=UPI00137187EF|nr:energy transducer TonB [Flavobacterium sp. Sd200]MXN91628.1 hypothetical protein [Flavobacterium sp. Sd200]